MNTSTNPKLTSSNTSNQSHTRRNQESNQFGVLSPRMRLIILILSMLSLLGIGILLSPRALAFYYHNQASKLIDEVVDSQESINLLDVACAHAPLTDNADRVLIEQALESTQKAIHYNPNSAYAHLLGGRAYCLLGDPESAVKAIRNFTRLRPNNPLGHLELALAYISLCDLITKNYSKTSETFHCSSNIIKKNILAEFTAANIDPTQLLVTADNEFWQQRWSKARFYYSLYKKLGQQMQPERLFRNEIAEILSNQEQGARLDTPTLLATYAMTDSVRIQAIKLQWLSDGNTLVQTPGNDPSIGVLWWNGDAISGVKLLESGEVKITVRAQNTLPPPVRFQVLVDFQPAATIELSRGDMSWQEVDTNIPLSAGYHIIGIRFLNDDFVNGVDRNLSIEWLQVQK